MQEVPRQRDNSEDKINDLIEEHVELQRDVMKIPEISDLTDQISTSLSIEEKLARSKTLSDEEIAFLKMNHDSESNYREIRSLIEDSSSKKDMERIAENISQRKEEIKTEIRNRKEKEINESMGREFEERIARLFPILKNLKISEDDIIAAVLDAYGLKPLPVGQYVLHQEGLKPVVLKRFMERMADQSEEGIKYETWRFSQKTSDCEKELNDMINKAIQQKAA